MRLLRKDIGSEFVRFAVVGVTATGVHYAVYWLLQHVLNVNVAYTAGYLAGFVLNFYLTARFTFRTRPSWTKLFGMGAAHAVNYGLSNEWAPLPVFAIAVPVNFLLVRFVFKRKEKEHV